MIGTAVEYFLLASGGTGEGGRFGIEDNTSDQDRDVNFQDNALFLKGLSSFLVDGEFIEVFTPYNSQNMYFDQTNPTNNPDYDNYSFLLVFDNNDDTNLADTWPNETLTAMLEVDGVLNSYEFQRLFMEQFNEYAFYAPVLAGTVGLYGFLKPINDTVDVEMNIPRIEPPSESRSMALSIIENIEDLDTVFITKDNKIIRGWKSNTPATPTWQNTLNQGGALAGAFIPWSNGDRTFQIYGNENFDPFFSLQKNSDPFSVKALIGCSELNVGFKGLLFFYDRAEVSVDLKYLFVDPLKMLTDDQILPDVGFTKMGYSHYFEMKAGESVDRGIGMDHNIINVTNNANVIIRLDTGDYLIGKPFTIKNSGTGIVTLKDALVDGIADYTMNVQNSCIEIICTGTEYKITSKYTP